MSNPWDDVRRESGEPEEAPAHHRASPLPWMLLVVSLSLTAGVLVLGRMRLEEERARTANALKGNDEIKGRVKQLEAELGVHGDGAEPTQDEAATLKKQLVTLELEKRRLQEELRAAKKH